ncbi:YacL family protein [Shewanella gelidii]|uniref:UPF0231 protein n=1 Tax=Shewanella gelidii TaxID=1642821 RepID=A0A917JQG0_9GAMM|nr:YacL family protein [Shewanella gelidii]MCL1099306.1 YacL family protein [Shewanella gelidii]GGI77532.1 UPF0231 protein [Shewanella gelidii]
MEYEFRRNTLTGTFQASFSMDHEVLGLWFSEELADNRAGYIEISQAIVQLQKSHLKSWRYVGKGLTLELDSEQARVFANALEMQETQQLDESMSFYDAESEAFCGLEDFEVALQSWRKFLDESS